MEKSLDKQMVNSELINSYNNIAVQNAIISQHTLFPYHFVKNGKELNELGNSDLKVLAKHFLRYPGKLNIRRSNVPQDLYQGRINFVLRQLKEAGVKDDQISISDAMPGGPGMLSEKILIIVEEDSGRTSSE
jgi:hypothetical protein